MKITEMVESCLSTHWERFPLGAVEKSARRLLKSLSQSYKACIAEDKKDLCAQILTDNFYLIQQTGVGLFRCDFLEVWFAENQPVLGETLGEFAVLNKVSDEFDKVVVEFLQQISKQREIFSSDVDTIVTQYKFALLKAISRAYSENNDELLSNAVYALHKSSDIDMEFVTASANPLEISFSQDKLYCRMTSQSRATYRRKTAQISQAAGVSEERLAWQYLTFAAQNEEFIGFQIEQDYRRVFPLMGQKAYCHWLLWTTIALTAISGFFVGWWYCLLLFLPYYAIAKWLVDLGVNRKVRHISGALMARLELNGNIPHDAQTLAVISTLLTDENSVAQALAKAESISRRNPTDNLHFCLLCDFPQSSEPTEKADRKINNACRDMIGDFENVTIILRKRSYCKTQNCYTGWERKRGSIEQLVRLIKGEKQDFYCIYGKEIKEDTKYILALDYDTEPLMDSIAELVSIALLPVNKPVITDGRVVSGFGIIAPKMTNSLKSSLATTFSKLMSGGGGNSTGTYERLSADLYMDGFEEGIFAGKGLIDVSAFYEICCGKFPEERILSHDILEGSLLRTAFCEVEFTDSFPANTTAYFKRQHRWLRGDLQNIPYIFGKIPYGENPLEKRPTPLSPISRHKLWDNVRRVITPLFILGTFYSGNLWVSLVGLVSLLLPYVAGFAISIARGGKFALTQRYYSNTISRTKRLLCQCIMEIILLPKNALVSLSAICRTLWRMVVSKKNLLEWTTAQQQSKVKSTSMKTAREFLWAEIISLPMLVVGNWIAFCVGALCLSALPVMLVCNKAYTKAETKIPQEIKDGLTESVRLMLGFYDKYVCSEDNFLPPDNVQYTPVYAVAHRTSPTNIGMYLLSVLCGRIFGIVEDAEVEEKIRATLLTIDKLDKWNGNLYNWYDTITLKTLDGFVSAVDSGNFVCCLVALKEGLLKLNLTENISLIEKLIQQTDLSVFYNKTKSLLRIGYDSDKGEFAKNHYDLLMSEARMASFFAIAKGQVPKKHWKALGRTMAKSGNYAGAVSWTGTCFEYFMPELLLPSEEGSFVYESLKFALHCQRRQFSPFGVSESAYYAFDNMLNYQYKAHGIQRLGLKQGLNRDRVIAPYASFLTLSYDLAHSYNNLVSLRELGAFDKDFGFYEAVDFTKERVPDGIAIIKSHMAHHVGMSILGATNALYGNILQQYFMADKDMGRAVELLEEQVLGGGILYQNYENNQYKHINQDSFQNKTILPFKQGANKEEITEFFPETPKSSLLANGSITAIYTDSGYTQSIYKNALGFFPQNNPIDNARGFLCGFREGKDLIPIGTRAELVPFLMEERKEVEKQSQYEQSVIFGESSAEYYTNFRNLYCGMKCTLDGSLSCETREFAVKNNASNKRLLKLCVYIEPALATKADILAHPAFMDLFLKCHYDSGRNVFIASRKSRHSDEQMFMGVAFAENVPLQWSLNRESVIDRSKGVYSFLSKCLEQNESESVPAPCIYFQADFTVGGKSQVSSKLIIAYGDSENDILEKISAMRKGCINPLQNRFAGTSPQGRIANQLLPFLLGNFSPQKEILAAISDNILNYKALWKWGISADLPIVVLKPQNTENPTLATEQFICSLLKAQQELRLCQINFDLAIVTDKSGKELILSQLEQLAQERFINVRGGVFILLENEISRAEQDLVLSAAVYLLKDNFNINLKAEKSYNPMPIYNSKSGIKDKQYGFFSEDKYVINSTPPNAWCNVLANPRFGTLVSESSLGFSWAENSHENKLSPWSNNLLQDNEGERLLLKGRNRLYDIVKGSQAVFGENYACYNSKARNIAFNVKITIMPQGMGKIIDVSLDNLTDKTKNIELAYYVDLLLGVDKGKGQRIKFHRESNTLVGINNGNMSVCGAATISAKSEKLSDKNLQYICNCNKIDVFSGRWTESLSPCPFPCGAVIVKWELPPRASEKIRFILAFTENENSPLSMEKAVENPISTVQSLFRRENKITIATPDKQLDTMFNHWLMWQTVGGRIFARTGFYQNGGAFGFRDQLQDSMAAVYSRPWESKRLILRGCNAQFEQGDVLHWWHVLPAEKKGTRTRYSDDLLWLPFVTAFYVEKTSDTEIMDTKVHFAKGDMLSDNEHERYMTVEVGEKADVYTHCKRSLEWAYKLGVHGLMLMGCGDWNDGYNKVGINGSGESVWLSMFYVMTAERFMRFAREREAEYYVELQNRCEHLRSAINNSAYENGYYLRAFFDNGEKMGSQDNAECKIDLLPQAFAVLSDIGDKTQKLSAVNNALTQLVDYDNDIIKLFTPPFDRDNFKQDAGYVKSYPVGVRENGGQYTHAAIWLAMAVLEMGFGDEGYQLVKMLNPSIRNSDIFKNEPYFMSADIYTNPQAFGRGGWSIYTGAAGWYYQCILQSLLGINIKDGQLFISPKIPNSWQSFSVELHWFGTDITLLAERGGKPCIIDNDIVVDSVKLDGKVHLVKVKM